MVVEDCTEALKHNKKYSKCLMRRAAAAEELGDLTQALEGKCLMTKVKVDRWLS